MALMKLGRELGTIVGALKERGVTDPFTVDQIQLYAPSRYDMARAYLDILYDHLYKRSEEPGADPEWRSLLEAYSGQAATQEKELIQWGLLQRDKESGQLYMPKSVLNSLEQYLDINNIHVEQ